MIRNSRCMEERISEPVLRLLQHQGRKVSYRLFHIGAGRRRYYLNEMKQDNPRQYPHRVTLPPRSKPRPIHLQCGSSLSMARNGNLASSLMMAHTKFSESTDLFRRLSFTPWLKLKEIFLLRSPTEVMEKWRVRIPSYLLGWGGDDSLPRSLDRTSIFPFRVCK